MFRVNSTHAKIGKIWFCVRSFTCGRPSSYSQNKLYSHFFTLFTHFPRTLDPFKNWRKFDLSFTYERPVHHSHTLAEGIACRNCHSRKFRRRLRTEVRAGVVYTRTLAGKGKRTNLPGKSGLPDPSPWSVWSRMTFDPCTWQLWSQSGRSLKKKKRKTLVSVFIAAAPSVRREVKGLTKLLLQQRWGK